MDQQVMDAPSDSGAGAVAAFEGLRRQLAMLVAAMEAFAARQERLEQRDYSPDLARIVERQDKIEGAISELVDRPALKLTPTSLTDDIGKAAAKLRAPDQAAMNEARDAMAAIVWHVRTEQKQIDALILTTIVATGLTALLLVLALLFVHRWRPDAAADLAAAILHESKWDAGAELMASGDPDGWQQLVAARQVQQDNMQATAACQKRTRAAGRSISCSIKVTKPTSIPHDRAQR